MKKDMYGYTVALLEDAGCDVVDYGIPGEVLVTYERAGITCTLTMYTGEVGLLEDLFIMSTVDAEDYAVLSGLEEALLYDDVEDKYLSFGAELCDIFTEVYEGVVNYMN